MHESSLGKDVLQAVLRHAEKAGASRVRVVRGFVAETEWLDPKAIAFHFSAHARGTLAEGAQLELETRWIEADCLGCKKRYKPDHHVILCPHCGSTEANLLGEPGLRIETIEVD